MDQHRDGQTSGVSQLEDDSGYSASSARTAPPTSGRSTARRTEVLGGIVNQYRSGDGRLEHNPAFELIDADGSFIASTSGPTDRQFKTILRETRGPITRALQNTEFPIREENKIHIPLVVGTGRTP